MAPTHYSEVLGGRRGLPYAGACHAYEIGVPAEILLNLKSLQPKRAKGNYQRLKPITPSLTLDQRRIDSDRDRTRERNRRC